MAKDDAPVGVQEVEAGGHPLPDGARHDTNMVETKRILPPEIAETETSVLETVLQYGTAKAAALGEFAAGKTGTTSNYGDAWFVGWNHKYTVAVWVGYPNSLVPMTTQFDGSPVLGGTFPALIWHDFMVSALGIEKERAEHAAGSKRGAGSQSGASGTSESTTPSATGATPGQATAPTTGGGAGAGKEGAGKSATPGGGAGGGEAGTGTPKAGAEPEHAASPTPATPTPEAPSAPSTPSAPAPSTPGAGGIPNSPSPTGGVSAGG
jgi:penicillin-binding protein 1A